MQKADLIPVFQRSPSDASRITKIRRHRVAEHLQGPFEPCLASVLHFISSTIKSILATLPRIRDAITVHPKRVGAFGFRAGFVPLGRGAASLPFRQSRILSRGDSSTVDAWRKRVGAVSLGARFVVGFDGRTTEAALAELGRRRAVRGHGGEESGENCYGEISQGACEGNINLTSLHCYCCDTNLDRESCSRAGWRRRMRIRSKDWCKLAVCSKSDQQIVDDEE